MVQISYKKSQALINAASVLKLNEKLTNVFNSTY